MLQVWLGKWSVPSLASALLTSHALLTCSIKTILRPCCRRLTRLIDHTRRGGVQNDSGMELRPEIMDGISPADPKRSSTEVYHTSRIISHSRKSKPVKLSRMSNVKRKVHVARVYRVWCREKFPWRHCPWQLQSAYMATPTRGLVIAGSQNGVGSKYAAEDFANIPSLYILRKG